MKVCVGLAGVGGKKEGAGDFSLPRRMHGCPHGSSARATSARADFKHRVLIFPFGQRSEGVSRFRGRRMEGAQRRAAFTPRLFPVLKCRAGVRAVPGWLPARGSPRPVPSRPSPLPRGHRRGGVCWNG